MYFNLECEIKNSTRSQCHRTWRSFLSSPLHFFRQEEISAVSCFLHSGRETYAEMRREIINPTDGAFELLKHLREAFLEEIRIENEVMLQETYFDLL